MRRKFLTQLIVTAALIGTLLTPAPLYARKPSTSQLRGVEAISTETFEQKVLKAEGPVLVFVTADWCPVCQRTAPGVSDFALNASPDLNVVALDDDKNRDLTRQLGVKALPTFIYFENGKVIARKSGGYDPQELQRWLQPFYSNFKTTAPAPTQTL